jgi:branched-chain amino acid transport system substrate-binding protein
MALQILRKAGRGPGARRWRYCSLAVGAALLLSGCAGAAQQNANSDSDESGPIVIGTSLPLSGEFSQPGGAPGV